MCETLPVDKRKNRGRKKDTRVFNVLRVVQDDEVCQSAHRAGSVPAATVTTAGWERKDVTRNIPGTEAELDLRRQRPSPQLGGRRRMSRQTSQGTEAELGLHRQRPSPQLGGRRRISCETYQVRRQSWICADSDRHHSWVGGEGCHAKHPRIVVSEIKY